MKKLLSLLLTALLLLGLIGCKQQELPVQTSLPTTETTVLPDPTAPPETTVSATDPPEVEPTLSTESSETNSPSEETEATEPTHPETSTENVGKQEPPKTNPTDPPATEPTQPATEPTDPPTTQPTETEPPETEPVETQPPETEPVETQPADTEPSTEPVECQHDWLCIHHDEEGHWQAGIACDCGWVAYGNPDELVAQWNTHSASYPAAESLFNHGGYGSVDEWIVDNPAYDEWVCRHCGEPKP